MIPLFLGLALAVEGTVTLPLTAIEAIETAPVPLPPSVRLGRAAWTGDVDAQTGAMALRAELVADLRGTGWKSVPLLGRTAVVQEVRVGGKAVPISVDAANHLWITDQQGPVTIEVIAWVPSSGQRGSLEYDVPIPRTPATRLVLTLPQPDLRPEVLDAVRSDVQTRGGRTVLTADLAPTQRLHVVGLRDLRSDDARPPELYAETSHLISIDDHRVEVFAVVRYSILYAGASHFDLFVPDGLQVVGADGEGAFQYDVEPVDGGTLLRGQTRHPIRNRYEISVRLQRQRTDGPTTLALPHARGVAREHGWVGLEVPGRVRVTDRSAAGLDPLQIQQLPAEVRDASVSPILDAWRFDGAGSLTWTAVELPQVEVSSERVDQVSARTVLAPGGRAVTELTMTLQNRSRHGVALTLPQGATITSASRDGSPVVPASRDGRIVLPLRRTVGQPQTLRVTIAAESNAPGWMGHTAFVLPVIDLPLAAVDWQLHLPEGHRWGDIEADVRSQTRTGSGSWLADPAQAAPVMAHPSQVRVPDAGEVRHYARYWVDGDVPIVVRVRHTAPWLAALARLAVGLGLLGAGALFLRGRRREHEAAV